MSRMIPSIIDSKAPPGEKKVFQALRDAKGTDTWVVLHSLGIAEHINQVEGEADFVLIIPNLGILVIEVKSHQSVHRSDDGLWYLGKDRPTSRSPFKQARGNMHSIRNFIATEMPLIEMSLVFASTVWFTNTSTKGLPKSIEWEEWELLDESSFQNLVGTIVNVLKAETERVNKGGFRNVISLTLENFAEVINKLRPKFDIALNSKELSKRRNMEVKALTDEQFDFLDGLEKDRFVLIEGSAGTGKTFLAAEAALRMDSIGESVLFICRSELLAKKLRSLLNLSDKSFVGSWSEINSVDFIDRKFDSLVIDEAQDLVDKNFLDLIQSKLKTSLNRAKMRFFADYEGQRLYEVQDARVYLANQFTDMHQFVLTRNCRNLPAIGDTALYLGGRKDIAIKYRRIDDGITPTFITYQNGETRVHKLDLAVRDLLDDGFLLEDILVLFDSSQLSEELFLRELEHSTNLFVKFDLDFETKKARWSDVLSFKGLDHSAVIIYGLETQRDSLLDPFIYVALTRARDRLILIVEREFLAKRVTQNA